jgi:hypothetical protein
MRDPLHRPDPRIIDRGCKPVNYAALCLPQAVMLIAPEDEMVAWIDPMHGRSFTPGGSRR